ncbi:ubiquitin-activating enzyme-like protein [Perkinsela sp. CCAP 1560/4]|nr:ubiquitin-activating enzyme-like protein [Perkinsela sp. CCAP 1560/4]|eukprot:KNH07732.1 ubiquitin-activating enzyme-like protein [Perkinsela sp. CCAP 1560/4]
MTICVRFLLPQSEILDTIRQHSYCARKSFFYESAFSVSRSVQLTPAFRRISTFPVFYYRVLQQMECTVHPLRATVVLALMPVGFLQSRRSKYHFEEDDKFRRRLRPRCTVHAGNPFHSFE